MSNNYYEMLRIAPDADTATIKAAYRKLAQLYHPDKRTNKKFANHKFKMINEAYGVLSVPEKRAEYDRTQPKATKNKAKKKANKKQKSTVCEWTEGAGDSPANPPSCYRDGEMHGHWTIRFADGTVSKGSYVDGEMHGHWTLRYADGAVSKGPYVDGEMHGHWTLRAVEGTVDEGPYVDGERHGHWTERLVDGSVWQGTYVNGESHGLWTVLQANGQAQTYNFVNGKMQERREVETEKKAEKESDNEWWIPIVCVGIGFIILKSCGN